MPDLPSHARVVIIGGGVIGCSVAYHLTKLGWKDVVLLERKQLTSGTTWHAAGLIAQLRATANMTKLARYSQELYGALEGETGVATGFKRCGSITAALTSERMEELQRQAAMARAFEVEVDEVSPSEVKARYEHLNIDGVVGGVYLPLDGQGDPSNIALALAKGARQRGAKVQERVAVAGVARDRRRITGVDWVGEDGSQGHIACDAVVNCAGMWGHDVGKMLGTNVPLQACEHFYIVTENIAGLTQMPVLRVPDECAYFKEDAGKILLGALNQSQSHGDRSPRISSLINCPKILTILNRYSKLRSTGCRCWPKPVFTRFSMVRKVSRLMTRTILDWRLRWTMSGWLRVSTR